jgi:TolB-like protein/Tfp pilus assembly protein PilF
MTSDASTPGEVQPQVRVFLSYTRQDRAPAEQVIAALEQVGCRVWWDGLLDGGVAFATTTEDELECADAVVVLWSRTAVTSHWVLDEATRGRERGRLVPVSLDGAMAPLGFRQYQLLDLSKWRGSATAPEITNLLRAVMVVAGQKDAPARILRPAKARINRRQIIMAGGGLVLATAGGGFAVWKSGLFGRPVDTNSVAVLPFKNLSGNADQDYFSDGLSEEMRSALARIALLKVAAPTSSIKFRDHAEDAKTVARKLGVAYLLEGSVRRSGDVVRIAAELIDGKTGFSRWANSFDRKIKDIFAVQSEIANTVASALVKEVSKNGRVPARNEKASSGGTTNVPAFDAYLRGKALYSLHADEKTYRAALAQFDAAISADPDYAAAYSARARSLTSIANQFAGADQFAALYGDAEDSARHAVALAPRFADAHSTLGVVLFQGKLDFRGARKPFEVSRMLGPGDANVLARFATFCATVGRFAEATEAISHALQLDPLNPAMYNSAGFVQYSARHYAEAIPLYTKALELNPKMPFAHAAIGNSQFGLGKYREARAEYMAEPLDVLRLPALAIVDRKLGNEAASRDAMKKLTAERGEGASYQQAQILSQWGLTGAALDKLEHAASIGDTGVTNARNDPMLDPLRREPRYIRLLKQLGFD